MPCWLRSSENKVQTNVFCCCLMVNLLWCRFTSHVLYNSYTIVCIVPWCPGRVQDCNRFKHECSISNVFLCVIALLLSGTFQGPQNRHGIFLGLIFGSGIFLVFGGSPRDFFGSWLLAPFDHPRHLKSRVPPLGWCAGFLSVLLTYCTILQVG